MGCKIFDCQRGKTEMLPSKESKNSNAGRCVYSIYYFTITAEFHARSLANFYGHFAERHMNLKFMRRVSERARAIRQFIIVKNKLMSVFMSLSCY